MSNISLLLAEELNVKPAYVENVIALPVAIYAETLWDCKRAGKETVQQVMKYPCVTVANL